MSSYFNICRIGIVGLGLYAGFSAAAGEWTGFLAAETRLFFHDPLDAVQQHESLSVSFQPEFQHQWDDGYQRFVFTPFMRLDQRDDERSHADIRELYWEKSTQRWDLRLGIRKVYWGVAESQHLVDIINQTDLVENPDTEDKLGQPMVNLALVNSWGTLDLYLLPGFRQRTFPGPKGRLRAPVKLDADDAKFESSAEELHIDAAVRWSHSLGDWDLALSHFYGTSREPRFLSDFDGFRPRLFPFYDLIHQTGVEVQYTKGGMLGKFEAIHRSGQGRTFTALTAGFEYTFYSVFGSALDIGVLGEYLYDSRKDEAPTPFEDDFFAGFRLGFNDTQNTSVLAGVIVDPDTGASSWGIEASRRLGESWTLSVEARAFNGLSPEDPAFAFHRDDFLQVELAWYF